MATSIQVVIDCVNPDRLAHFWAEALHYKIQDPPEGFATWQDFLREHGVPEDQWDKASAVVDPDGAGPRVFFQKVPEGKAAKNRVHLDLNVSNARQVGAEEGRKRVDAEVQRLVDCGASMIRPGDPAGDEYFTVMQDPEGNEFCVQ